VSINDAHGIIPHRATLSLIRTLAHAKREGDADALAQAEPLFESTPHLREIVHSIVIGTNQSEAQGERSRARKPKTEKRNVVRARDYLKRRPYLAASGMSDSDIKEACGKSPPMDPKSGKPLRKLKRSRAIETIDEGLRLIDTGRYALVSG
jgi:hypothetical protein